MDDMKRCHNGTPKREKYVIDLTVENDLSIGKNLLLCKVKMELTYYCLCFAVLREICWCSSGQRYNSSTFWSNRLGSKIFDQTFFLLKTTIR